MKDIQRFLLIGFLFLLFSSCSPNSSAEFVREGQARCEWLVKDLEKIENRQQLIEAEGQLKKHFESLVDLMIEAKEFQGSHPEDSSLETASVEWGYDLELENELRRIYAIEGGREMIEKAQHEALVRLDAYENSLSKRSLR